MSKITPCLWFNYQAEEAAKFYVSLLPNSRIDKVTRSPADNPSMKAGGVLTVEFTLAGQPFVGLNGGPQFPFTEAVSFTIDCEDQAEVDRLWEVLAKDGGQPGPCGWIKDRFGLSWQIVPRALTKMLDAPDREAAGRAMTAMLKMGKIDIATIKRAFEGSPAAS
jgi:predicted 3-demethylubiquinone-9 3-methyltransferase (glyoxalase superfamily)